MARLASQPARTENVKAAIAFCCPSCKGELTETAENYRCQRCDRAYPVIHGIPDFRLWPDPYISFQNEYQKVALLVEAAPRYEFKELVRFYWDITPEVPRDLRERYIRYVLSAEDRGRAVLEEVDTNTQTRVIGDTCLELGCGTAGFLTAAGSRFRQIVGIDIALRWLIIAKKRLEETGTGGQLVCCNAEHLPIRDEVFDCVVGIHMLEHSQDRRRVVTEAGRVLLNEGIYFFSTPNRFSLTPEPCVRVWGVGFLPRPLASPYVRLIRGIPYRHIHLMSAFELKRLCVASIRGPSTVSLPRISAVERQMLSRGIRILVSVYHALLRVPVLSGLMRLCAPLLQISGRKQCTPIQLPQSKA